MTAATATAPRRPTSGQPSVKRMTIADITGKGNNLPNRYILHATEGWGKTSFGAHWPKPVFIQTGAETGLETLIDAGRLPEVAHFPAVQSWEELLQAVEALATEEHPYRTAVIDTLNGAESLCHNFICHRDFADEWGNKGFGSYNKGYEVALPEWSRLLVAFDRLRTDRRMTVLLLCHTKVKAFKNPEGPDYDRYQPDVHEKTWSLTHKWADCVLFGNFETTVRPEKDEVRKGKAVGGSYRLLYTERHASFDAKNRLGLPGEIEMGESAADAWANFSSAIKTARTAGKEAGE